MILTTLCCDIKLVRDEGICGAQRAILAEFILSDIFTRLSCTTTTVQTSEILFCYFDCSEVPAVSDSHLPSTSRLFPLPIVRHKRRGEQLNTSQSLFYMHWYGAQCQYQPFSISNHS